MYIINVFNLLAATFILLYALLIGSTESENTGSAGWKQLQAACFQVLGSQHGHISASQTIEIIRQASFESKLEVLRAFHTDRVAHAVNNGSEFLFQIAVRRAFEFTNHFFDFSDKSADAFESTIKYLQVFDCIDSMELSNTGIRLLCSKKTAHVSEAVEPPAESENSRDTESLDVDNDFIVLADVRDSDRRGLTMLDRFKNGLLQLQKEGSGESKKQRISALKIHIDNHLVKKAGSFCLSNSEFGSLLGFVGGFRYVTSLNVSSDVSIGENNAFDSDLKEAMESLLFDAQLRLKNITFSNKNQGVVQGSESRVPEEQYVEHLHRQFFARLFKPIALLCGQNQFNPLSQVETVYFQNSLCDITQSSLMAPTSGSPIISMLLRVAENMPQRANLTLECAKFSNMHYSFIGSWMFADRQSCKGPFSVKLITANTQSLFMRQSPHAERSSVLTGSIDKSPSVTIFSETGLIERADLSFSFPILTVNFVDVFFGVYKHSHSAEELESRIQSNQILAEFFEKNSLLEHIRIKGYKEILTLSRYQQLWPFGSNFEMRTYLPRLRHLVLVDVSLSADMISSLVPLLRRPGFKTLFIHMAESLVILKRPEFSDDDGKFGEVGVRLFSESFLAEFLSALHSSELKRFYMGVEGHDMTSFLLKHSPKSASKFTSDSASRYVLQVFRAANHLKPEYFCEFNLPKFNSTRNWSSRFKGFLSS